MFFVLSKLLWALLAPSVLLVVVLAYALACGLWPRLPGQKWARAGGKVALVIAALVLVLPIGHWAMQTWERQNPPVAMPLKPTGMVILGGALDPFLSKDWGQLTIGSAAERVAILPRFMREHPDAKIFYAGGSGWVRRQDLRESDAAKQLFHEWNLPTKNVIFERRSRNTIENALNAKRMLKPKPGEQWLLVTSAAHMPRALAVFRHLGWDIIPYPVDFRSDPQAPLLCFCWLENWQKLDQVSHEIVGFAAYHLTGKL